MSIKCFCLAEGEREESKPTVRRKIADLLQSVQLESVVLHLRNDKKLY